MGSRRHISLTLWSPGFLGGSVAESDQLTWLAWDQPQVYYRKSYVGKPGPGSYRVVALRRAKASACSLDSEPNWPLR